MCSLAEVILLLRYFSSKLSYPITGPCLLQYLWPSGHKPITKYENLTTATGTYSVDLG